MICRVCQESQPATMEVARNTPASALCVECGAAVCDRHGLRSPTDPRILCTACRARVWKQAFTGADREQRTQVHQR